ncbi:N(2)-acetyl-L-2,4-diaminobutanoate deacetylase DoeB2 [Cellulomonas bogoriensis]|uniref:N(2)-acetyl-L-2,4-diaminobutanoate deacetylase DoeB2 n=1 Tax=Cellulomonas bogoriensis TaxID=301388 RepID=UPI00068931DC|nr:N(2)-acetyl-L-2,4-diaminobutanoate deacetylase DoeB2 [Cellulomonas bogoriensis]
MQDWDEIVADGVVVRRALHQHPELAWSEDLTAAAVREHLDRLGLGWRPCAGTGTVAVVAPAARGRHVALRADLDAMPVPEATGAPWVSQVPGVMHACGHDGHTAVLLVVARWLAEHQEDLPGPVTLLFQPAEEGGHGARHMIADGALGGDLVAGGRPVEVVYGWHNWPAIPFGQAVCPDGPVMSANATFRVEVTGAGGHASQPEATRDPVLAAAAITVALQQVVARRLPPHVAAVVAVTTIDARAGSATVTPETAFLEGSIRVPDTSRRDEVLALIDEVADATARAHGVRARTVPAPRYGATVNHPAAAERMRGALAGVLGEEWSGTLPVPVLASEDFSYYLDAVPGAFALIGSDDGQGHHEPCHSPRYDFNDALIDPVARVLVRLAGAPSPSDPARAQQEATAQ